VIGIVSSIGSIGGITRADFVWEDPFDAFV
jgi:hypothetical protein